MEETFVLCHRPQVYMQLASCEDPGDQHPVHRRLTGLAHYICNCGYSSGWVPKNELPLPSDFIRDHLPPDYELSQGDFGHE